MRTILFVLGLAAIVGTGCDDTGSSDEPLDCTALSQADCEASAGCMAFFGSPLIAEAQCFGAEEFIACGPSASAECNNAIEGTVVGPGGECWNQSSACFSNIPGFSADVNDQCGIHDVPSCGDVNCNDLNEAACNANPECASFVGKKYDPNLNCFPEENEFIACGSWENSGCNNSNLGAVFGPNGECWAQSGACFSAVPGYSSGAFDACGSADATICE